MEDAPYHVPFIWVARPKQDAVSLQVLSPSFAQEALGMPILIHQLTAQPVSKRTAMSKSQGRNSTLGCKYFGGQFSAVLSSHDPFENS